MKLSSTITLFVTLCVASNLFSQTWIVDSSQQWQSNNSNDTHFQFENGLAVPLRSKSVYRSVWKIFPSVKQLRSVKFKQSPAWDNWSEIPDITPSGLKNALVFLPVQPGDYYVLAALNKNDLPPSMTAEQKADLIKNNNVGGYHAWHSTDLEDWTYCGRISNKNWVTTAEHKDGTFYIYYDAPNDQDPHLIIDEDLKDVKRREV